MSGPKTIQLPPVARAVLHDLPRTSRFVFPNPEGIGPMTDLGSRWQKLRAPTGSTTCASMTAATRTPPTP